MNRFCQALVESFSSDSQEADTSREEAATTANPLGEVGWLWFAAVIVCFLAGILLPHKMALQSFFVKRFYDDCPKLSPVGRRAFSGRHCWRVQWSLSPDFIGSLVWAYKVGGRGGSAWKQKRPPSGEDDGRLGGPGRA